MVGRINGVGMYCGDNIVNNYDNLRLIKLD
jgi:hypothetical protein